jgi:hypothetical protein
MQLLAPFSHHEAPGDPTLFEWIKERIDHSVDVDPFGLVVFFGFLVLIVPVLIILTYVIQRRYG